MLTWCCDKFYPLFFLILINIKYLTSIMSYVLVIFYIKYTKNDATHGVFCWYFICYWECPCCHSGQSRWSTTSINEMTVVIETTRQTVHNISPWDDCCLSTCGENIAGRWILVLPYRGLTIIWFVVLKNWRPWAFFSGYDNHFPCPSKHSLYGMFIVVDRYLRHFPLKSTINCPSCHFGRYYVFQHASFNLFWNTPTCKRLIDMRRNNSS